MTNNTYQKSAALKMMVVAAALVLPIAFAQTAAKFILGTGKKPSTNSASMMAMHSS